MRDHYTTDTILRAVLGQPASQSMNATCRMATACVSVFISKSKSQRKGRESNHRFLDVAQVSSPLDHGTRSLTDDQQRNVARDNKRR